MTKKVAQDTLFLPRIHETLDSYARVGSHEIFPRQSFFRIESTLAPSGGGSREPPDFFVSRVTYVPRVVLGAVLEMVIILVFDWYCAR